MVRLSAALLNLLSPSGIGSKKFKGRVTQTGARPGTSGSQGDAPEELLEGGAYPAGLYASEISQLRGNNHMFFRVGISQACTGFLISARCFPV